MASQGLSNQWSNEERVMHAHAVVGWCAVKLRFELCYWQAVVAVLPPLVYDEAWIRVTITLRTRQHGNSGR